LRIGFIDGQKKFLKRNHSWRHKSFMSFNG